MPSLKPVTSEFLDTADFRVVSAVAVMAPIDRCWSLLVDQASWVQWFDGMTAVEATPWIWTEAGQARTVKVNGMSVHETAISVEAEREYAFTITKWPLPIATRAAEGVRLEDLTNGGSPRTRLTYIGAFEFNAVGGLGAGRLESQLGGTWRTALKNLGTLASTPVRQS